MRRVLQKLRELMRQGHSIWVGLFASALIVSIALSLPGPKTCSGQEALKKWLPKLPKRRYVSDKHVVESLVESLKLRKRELARKEQELIAARRSLEELQQRLKAMMAKMQEQQDKIKALLKKAEAQKQARIDNLVSVYGTMNAKSAATALIELFKHDRLLVSTLIRSLDRRRAAAILDAITASSPEVAAEITRRVGRYR